MTVDDTNWEGHWRQTLPARCGWRCESSVSQPGTPALPNLSGNLSTSSLESWTCPGNSGQPKSSCNLHVVDNCTHCWKLDEINWSKPVNTVKCCKHHQQTRHYYISVQHSSTTGTTFSLFHQPSFLELLQVGEIIKENNRGCFTGPVLLSSTNSVKAPMQTKQEAQLSLRDRASALSVEIW